ncbi:Uncharacterised protein [uncultured archaeon]|nr:Uncharacterised protein [uncultured archaeon]
MNASKNIIIEKKSKIVEICFSLVLLIVSLILLIGSVSAVQVCTSDPSFNPENGLTFTVGNNIDEVYHFVKDKDHSLGSCPLSGDGNAMLLAKVSWTTGICSQLSTDQLDSTPKKICNLAGYRDVNTFSSYYNMDGGRCNYFTPADDCLWYWNGFNWQYSNSDNGAGKFNYRWITKLSCINKLPTPPVCTEVNCASNSDCDDDKLYTEDKCVNPGQTTSYCTNVKINCINNNDCGTTGFNGNEFCSGSDVFKNYQESKCINAGQTSSYCNVTNTATFLIHCGTGSCGTFGDNYCKNGDVYHSRTCNNKGCSIGTCFTTVSLEELRVEECDYGCADSACKTKPVQCTSDSNCESNQICLNNQCINVVCKNDVNCNDNNNHTEDKCLNPGTTNSSCQHNPISCLNNAECGTNGYLGQLSCSNNNVFDKYITYTCNNAGKTSSSCSNSTEDKQKTICSYGCASGICNQGQCNTTADCGAKQICSNHQCIDITCKSDGDCNDNNANTEDKCLNPGTTNSSCQHNPIPINNTRCSSNADCGTDRFTNICMDGNVFQRSVIFICNNPSTNQSSCSNMTQTNIHLNCNSGCTDGTCNSFCSSNTDCRSNPPSLKYCKDGNVYQDISVGSCALGTCSQDVTPKLVKTCSSKGCSKGTCIGSAPRDDDNNGEIPPEDVIALGAYIAPSSGINYTIINESIKVIPLSSGNAKTTGSNYFWIILLIILVVLFLVILLILLFNL